MTEDVGLTIDLDAKEVHIVQRVEIEMYGGGSTSKIQAIANADDSTRERWARIRRVVTQAGPVQLDETEWRLLYEGMHAMIYGLGGELHACTGLLPEDVVRFSRRVCNAAWRAWGKVSTQ